MLLVSWLTPYQSRVLSLVISHKSEERLWQSRLTVPFSVSFSCTLIHKHFPDNKPGHLDLTVVSRLELLIRKTCTTWGFLNELQVPLKPGGPPFPPGYVPPPSPTPGKGEKLPVCDSSRSMSVHPFTSPFRHVPSWISRHS